MVTRQTALTNVVFGEILPGRTYVSEPDLGAPWFIDTSWNTTPSTSGSACLIRSETRASSTSMSHVVLTTLGHQQHLYTD